MEKLEALEQYQKALKLGKKCYRDATIHGKYPYLPSLDSLLGGPAVAGTVELDLQEIPMGAIVGTRTNGRQNSFAANFMPLLPPSSEFADKWISLCADHLGEEGIRDPIRCVEYMGRFYVQEGNKRVSVLKSFQAATVAANVTRILPPWSQEPEILAYYDFLRFFELSRLYQVRFERPGRYSKLQAALGFESDHVWTEEERAAFLASFSRFQGAFLKKRREGSAADVSDALLVWLRVYPYTDLKTLSREELEKTLDAVWPDIQAAGEAVDIAVDTAPTGPDKGLMELLFGTGGPRHLHAVFVHALSPAESNWVRGHEQGRKYLEGILGDKVTTKAYYPEGPEDTPEALMERAIAEGGEVLFATSPQQIGACRRMAAKYPDVKVLNCALFMPYTGVRTYYSRIYEAKFLSGVIAGSLCAGREIGYIGSYPIFGVPAGINAFALGATLTYPKAKIRLRWACCPGDPLGDFDREGVRLVSNRDVPTLTQRQGDWGLSWLREDGTRTPLLSPVWNWGTFYEQVMRSILDGGWEATGSHGKTRPINYWWGMESGVVGLRYAPDLPEGSRALAGILERELRAGRLDPFRRPIRDRQGVERSDGDKWFSPEELLKMDWLCDNVEGEIPSFASLLPSAREVVRLQGVYRDQLPPEKEGVLL